jgi:hypothetical protein
MSKGILVQTPIYLVCTIFLALFFLSCTKKPSTQTTSVTASSARTPAAAPNGLFTTQRGYKVQLEPVQFGNAPASGKPSTK